MVGTTDLKEKVQKFLRKLEEKGIFFYYSEVYNEKEEIEAIQVFVPYEDIDIITTEYEDDLKKLKIVLSPAVEKKILKKYLVRLKGRIPIKIGNEIGNLSGNGFAVYLNWTNKSFVIHKYERGKFNSKTCKRVPFWETVNGIWVVDFSSCEEAKSFIGEVQSFLDKHFGVNYSVNYHRACGAYDECK